MGDAADVAELRWHWARENAPGHLYVVPDTRRNGVGEALVHTVLTEAQIRGYVKVVLSPTEQSIPLYRRCGFTEDNALMLWRP